MPFGYGRRRLTVEWSKVSIDLSFQPKGVDLWTLYG